MPGSYIHTHSDTQACATKKNFSITHSAQHDSVSSTVFQNLNISPESSTTTSLLSLSHRLSNLALLELLTFCPLHCIVFLPRSLSSKIMHFTTPLESSMLTSNTVCTSQLIPVMLITVVQEDHVFHKIQHAKMLIPKGYRTIQTNFKMHIILP